jgi:hypothetical protein
MHKDWLDEELGRALEHKPDTSVPDFDSVLKLAETRVAMERIRYRYVAAVAVIASVTAVTIAQWPDGPAAVDDEFMISAALLESTQWTAPSDVLMPQHQFDLYRDMPVFIGSTEPVEGTLL